MDGKIADLRLLRLAASMERHRAEFTDHVGHAMAQGARVRQGLERVATDAQARSDLFLGMLQDATKGLDGRAHKPLLLAAVLNVRQMTGMMHQFYVDALEQAHDEDTIARLRAGFAGTQSELQVLDDVIYAIERADEHEPGLDDHPVAENLQLAKDLDVFVGDH